MVNELVRRVEEFIPGIMHRGPTGCTRILEISEEKAFSRGAYNATVYLETYIDPHVKNMSIKEMRQYLYENNTGTRSGPAIADSPRLGRR